MTPGLPGQSWPPQQPGQQQYPAPPIPPQQVPPPPGQPGGQPYPAAAQYPTGLPYPPGQGYQPGTFPGGYPAPPGMTPKPGNMALVVVTAVVALGAAVFWGVRGVKGLLSLLRSWQDMDPTAAAYLAAQGHDLGTAKFIAVLPDAAELLAALVLLTGVVLLLLRTFAGVLLVAVGGGLGVLPPILFAVAFGYWGTPPTPPGGTITAAVLGLAALMLVLLPPVTRSVRRAPKPPATPAYPPQPMSPQG